MLGGLCGAVAFSYAQPALQKPFLSLGAGKLVLTDLIGVPYWLGALVLAAVLILVLAMLERSYPSRCELGHDFDGDMPSPPAETKIDPRVVAAP